VKEMWKSLSKDKRQKLILVGILSLIGVIVVGYLYVGAQLTTMSNGKKTIADLTGKLETAKNVAADEERNKPNRERLQAFVAAQHERMISGDPFSWVVREFTLIAEKHPVRVLSLRPGAQPVRDPKAAYGEYGVRIEVDGPYDPMGVFIADLENSFSSGEIRSIEVTAADPARADRHVVIDMALLVRPEEKPASAPVQKGESKAKS
jgi:hypothetical protein